MMLELITRKLVVLDVFGLPILRDWYVIHLGEKRRSPSAARRSSNKRWVSIYPNVLKQSFQPVQVVEHVPMPAAPRDPRALPLGILAGPEYLDVQAYLPSECRPAHRSDRDSHVDRAAGANAR